jgi:hypothetical protein
MAESATIELIRKNGATGVSPYDDSVIFHSAIGHDYTGATRGAVLKVVYKEFAFWFNSTTKILSIQAGYGILYGREFNLATGTTFDINLASLGNVYLLVYVEVNASVSPETAAIKTSYSTVQPTIGNTDIYKVPNGVATMPLFMFSVSSSGSILSMVYDYRHIREPGVAEAALSIPADGTINETKVSDLVEPDQTGYVLKARTADVGTTALSIGPAGNKNQIDANLKLTNKNCKLLVTRTQTLSSSSEIESGRSASVSWTAPSGTVIGFIVSITAQAYQTPSSYSSVSAGGFIDPASTTFFATIEDTVRNTPANGIRYDQSSYCWLQISLSATGVTITALEKIHSINVTVTMIIGGA